MYTAWRREINARNASIGPKSVELEMVLGSHMSISLPWAAPNIGVDFPRLLTVLWSRVLCGRDWVKHVRQLHALCVLDACSRKNLRAPVKMKSPWNAAMRLNWGLKKCEVCQVQVRFRT
jgi:hypothetical protein